jgi:transposase-like protein
MIGLKGENVASKSDIDPSVFSRNWRSIFGERKALEPGKYVWVNGEFVEERKARKKNVMSTLCKVRDSSLDVEVHRASRDMRKKETDLVRTEKGYRTL